MRLALPLSAVCHLVHVNAYQSEPSVRTTRLFSPPLRSFFPRDDVMSRKRDSELASPCRNWACTVRSCEGVNLVFTPILTSRCCTLARGFTAGKRCCLYALFAALCHVPDGRDPTFLRLPLSRSTAVVAGLGRICDGVPLRKTYSVGTTAACRPCRVIVGCHVVGPRRAHGSRL